MELGIGDHEGLTPLDLVIKDRLSHVNFHHSGNFYSIVKYVHYVALLFVCLLVCFMDCLLLFNKQAVAVLLLPSFN